MAEQKQAVLDLSDWSLRVKRKGRYVTLYLKRPGRDLQFYGARLAPYGVEVTFQRKK